MRKYINISILLLLLTVVKGNLMAMEGDTCKTHIQVQQKAWREIHQWVTADLLMPDKAETLMLIECHYNCPEKLVKLLSFLDRGKPYKYIVKYINPRLNRKRVEQVPSIATLPLPQSAISVIDTVREITIAFAPIVKQVEPEKPVSRSETKLAVKTNLLYNLALAPNIEIELPIGRRWSLNIEYKCPWWVNTRRNFCYQLLSGGVESRVWLGNRRIRNRLTGHFLGVYAEGGRYDFQFGGNDGYQGKYYAASGLTYGYTHPLAHRLAIEFSLGIGYLTTEYRKYTTYEGDLVWESSGRYNFLGPTKAKVSLVWLITGRR